MTKRWILAPGLLLLFVAASACSFSTANLSSLKVGKVKGVAQETSTFAPTDTIYATAVVSNAPGSIKVTGRLVIEDVAGQEKGPIPGLEKKLEFPGSATADFTFSPPTAGWPKGTYKIEVLMMNENGEQKDQKSASFTVS